MKEQFRSINFKPDSLAMIETCNNIIESEYQGIRITLRQLYYRLVGLGKIPNTIRSYKNIGGLVSDARLAGLMDWEAIEDLRRPPVIWNDSANIKEAVDDAVSRFRLPRWKGQPNYVELWVEKRALASVLEPLASTYHVTLMVNEGYSSSSAMYDSAQRIMQRCVEEDHRKEPVILYLGDHDPSGEDMVRDIEDRLTLFGVEDLDIRKVALTMEQVKQHKLPPQPAKTTDSRYEAYAAAHGTKSWEVDALDPRTLRQLITAAIREVVDMGLYERVIAKENRQREKMEEAMESIVSEDEDGDDE